MIFKKCDCSLLTGTEINSYKVFEELGAFFEQQVNKRIYKDVPVNKPFYIGHSTLKKREIKWYATKWYKCSICGCLWEFNYPDFPQKGFVRKFEDGKYIET
ncbi:MAG: hypothetical protein JXN65_02130 [Clostridia bacterium]|nr:hypothetical protein [Clostridia bacterium]